jgi:tRNA 2-thiocytidine biosynthesis protein TtcA
MQLNQNVEWQNSADFHQICRLAGEASVIYQMIEPGDKVLVGLSGGKDSMILCHVIEHLRRRARFDFSFITVTFNPMFPEFYHEFTAEYARMHGWEHLIIDFPMQQFLTEKNALKRPCSLCSRMRRGKLYGKAVELGCTKIALGHNLDDICVSFLMSLTRGQGLKTMAPKVKTREYNFKIIRPLAFVPEETIRAAAALAVLPDTGKCGFQTQLDENGDRVYFTNLLSQLEPRIPNIRQNMLYSLRSIRPEHLLDQNFYLP